MPLPQVAVTVHDAQVVSPRNVSQTIEADAVSDPTIRTSSKHRLSDDDNEDEPKKRQRIEHERAEQSPQSHALPSGREPDIFLPLKLSSRPFPRSSPHPTDDLVSLYSLGPLAASVARKDPLTGEKINVLRKSYKGKMKDFPGKNETIATQGQFFDLLLYPDEEWGIQRVQGNEMAGALTADGTTFDPDFASRLDQALDMAPGPLPRLERDKWRNIIDLDSAQPKPPVIELPSNPIAPPIKLAADQVRRPRRKGTSRGYSDDAFEGYAEGFGDDADDLGLEEDDRGGSYGSKKRRRRESAHFTAVPHYSTGAVSVGGDIA